MYSGTPVEPHPVHHSPWRPPKLSAVIVFCCFILRQIHYFLCPNFWIIYIQLKERADTSYLIILFYFHLPKSAHVY